MMTYEDLKAELLARRPVPGKPLQPWFNERITWFEDAERMVQGPWKAVHWVRLFNEVGIRSCMGNELTEADIHRFRYRARRQRRKDVKKVTRHIPERRPSRFVSLPMKLLRQLYDRAVLVVQPGQAALRSGPGQQPITPAPPSAPPRVYEQGDQLSSGKKSRARPVDLSKLLRPEPEGENEQEPEPPKRRRIDPYAKSGADDEQ